MRVGLALIGFIGLIAAVTPALKAERVNLSPSSDWILREYPDKCRVSQTFGEGDDRTTLWIDKGGPGPSINLTLIGRPLLDPYGAEIDLAFGRNLPVERNYIEATSSKGRPVIAMFGVQPFSEPTALNLEESGDEAESVEEVDVLRGEIAVPPALQFNAAKATTIDSLVISRALIKPLRLELDSFGSMMKELARCSQALSDRLSANSQPPENAGTPVETINMNKWSAKIAAHYPVQMLREEEEGRVAVRLTVNTAGKASFCEVIDYRGPAAFNDTACLLLLRNAEFKPATDAEGKTVPSFYTTLITYRLN